MHSDHNWAAGTIIYQIYPRSFQDSNGDGIGDLQGIIQRLDYLSELGINAVWLSPIYPSPMVDFGYDISDFTDIDPVFGTMQDFDELIEKAHHRGIRILMDYVPNHTSSLHPWFLESRSSKDNPKRDWYIWRDPKPDGSPPNNWKSNFGGSAWTYDEKTKQYYYHAFDREQPDLNWRNPEVVEAMLNVLRFWLKKGVDGFRVDAVYYLMEDEDLRDEAANPNFMAGTHSEHDTLIHTHTFALPETLHMMKQMSQVLQEFDNRFMVSEAYAELPEIVKMYHTIDHDLFAPFNFQFINLPWRADIQKEHIDLYDEKLGERYLPTYVLGNHDKPRVATRIGHDQARVAAMTLLTLRGLPFIYYGEEIGMEDTPIPPEKVIDPYEIKSPGLGLGRDPQRTPMQWSAEKFGGFSETDPWLPVNENYQTVNVVKEEQEQKGFLTLYKYLIKLKKHHPALREGVYTPLPSPADNVFAFLREKDAHKILVLLNFSHEEKVVSLSYEKVKVLCHTALEYSEGKIIDLTDFALGANEGIIFAV